MAQRGRFRRSTTTSAFAELSRHTGYDVLYEEPPCSNGGLMVCRKAWPFIQVNSPLATSGNNTQTDIQAPSLSTPEVMTAADRIPYRITSRSSCKSGRKPTSMRQWHRLAYGLRRALKVLELNDQVVIGSLHAPWHAHATDSRTQRTQLAYALPSVRCTHRPIP